MSICDISAENGVMTLVECLLPRGGSANMEGIGGSMLGNFDPKRLSKALHIVVSISGRAYPPEDDLDSGEDVEYSDIHLLFHRPTNYTRVWSVVNKSRLGVPEMSAWKHRSCHDSCWRTDGLRDISQVYLRVLGVLRDRNPGFRIDMHARIERVSTHEITLDDGPANTNVMTITSIENTKVLTR